MKQVYRGGFVHTYINTYTHFGLFTYRYGGASQSSLTEGASKSPYIEGDLHIQRGFAKLLHKGGL